MLYCFDLDGTLFNDQKKLTRSTKEMIRHILNENTPIMIATGRHYHYVKNCFHEFSSDKLYLSTNNGAMLTRLKDEKVIQINQVTYQQLRDLENFLMAVPLEAIHVYVNPFIEKKDIIITKHNNAGDLSKISVDFERITYTNSISECSNVLSVVLSGDLLTLRELLKKIPPAVQTSMQYHILEFSDQHGILEFMAKGANKWNSANTLVNYYSIPVCDVVSFGDNVNDRELLMHSGVGIAMKNADPAIQKLADGVTDFTNQEDGVQKYWVEHFKARQG